MDRLIVPNLFVAVKCYCFVLFILYGGYCWRTRTSNYNNVVWSFRKRPQVLKEDLVVVRTKNSDLLQQRLDSTERMFMVDPDQVNHDHKHDEFMTDEHSSVQFDDSTVRT